VSVLVTLGSIGAFLALWVTWIASRVDRLYNRTGAARASLDAQLVRRAAALQALVDRSVDQLSPQRAEHLRAVSRASLDADETTREAAENDLSRALREIPPNLDPELLADLADAARRVTFARRFYNDAVRDTVALRGQWLPRIFRLGRRRALPTFFEIDDTAPTRPAPRAGRASSARHPIGRIEPGSSRPGGQRPPHVPEDWRP
jgi:hypothetical protein